MTNKKQKIFLLLIMFYAVLTVVLARDFDFEMDKELAVSNVVLSKQINGESVDILLVHLFTIQILEKEGVILKKTPSSALGFLILESLNLDYFSQHKNGNVVLEYDYTPFWGYLKTEDKYVETFLNFNDKTGDFGGRSYCPDCGEPAASGTRFISISDQNPIWLKNIWIDFTKKYEIDLLWTIEGEQFELHYIKE